ncbi:MAG: hypothetical protein ABI383_05400 [Acidobacteriaceae bacterium]
MSVDAVSLSRTIEEFIIASPSPAVIEEGEVAFDFCNAKYSISSEHGRCLLHLWSAERNAMRRIIGAEQKPNSLRLTVQRFGQTKPTRMEIVRQRERRTASALQLTRDQYQRLLERTMERNFPGVKAASFSNKADLEKSFGPVYSRGMIMPSAGRTAWACLGVNAEETQAAVDGALSVGILWLDYLRERYAADRAFHGLKLFLPAGSSQVVRQRAAHLNHHLMKLEVWELDQREETIARMDIFDCGNIATRLVRSMHEQRVRDRFAADIALIGELTPDFDAVAVSSGELSFRMHGLEFARARTTCGSGNSLQVAPANEITFGIGPNATTLKEENTALFRDMVGRVARSRGGNGANAPKDPLWRMQPERWLESMVAAAVDKIDQRLSPARVYSQVPAFSSSDRAMIDVLCATHDGRLVVIELKAEEDLHLPLQGLDYWSRVRYHQQRGEFAQFGYFDGIELSPQPPLLLLVAPALHIHPSTDTLLRYLSPDIDCTVVGLDERWRQELRVVFRKRAVRTAV